MTCTPSQPTDLGLIRDAYWKPVKPYTDIIYEKSEDGLAKIPINRPHRRNAFTPDTVAQLIEAFSDAREDTRISVVLLTGVNPQTDGQYAFCSGGDQKIREIWYLCRQYNAQEAEPMGLVNKVVPIDQLEAEGIAWGRQIMQHSPLAIRCLKSAFNADVDGQQGLQELAGNATLLYYLTEQGDEGRVAWNEKRPPDFQKFPWLP